MSLRHRPLTEERVGKLEQSESRKEQSETGSSEHERANAVMKSQQLWSSAQDLHKIKPVSIAAESGEALTSPHL